MKTRTSGLILIAMILSFFLTVAPLQSAETNAGCPFNKEKKCQPNISPGPMGMSDGCRGMAKCHQWRHCSGCWEDLTPEALEKVKKERAAFQSLTRDFRQDLKSKNLALKSELMKKEPNAKTAMALQDEISKLSNKLDTEQLKHILSIKKIAPYAKLKCLKGGKGGDRKMNSKNSPFCKH